MPAIDRTLRLMWLLVALALVACSSSGRRLPEPDTRRPLGEGEVVGYRGEHGHHAWLGLRYAEPPVGELRFRAPQPVSLPKDARPALTYGDVCPQLAHPFGYREASTGSPVGSEDCLRLHVFAPAMTPETARGARLPVMVWLHGGGNVVGHAGNYDGGVLASRKRVIVVTPNYRLGPFGWFRHAALREGANAEDASGNFGLLDQIAALRWVHEHIAGFGGDPNNVTVFGESAGARNAINLLLAPSAKGLFHRVIAQSGSARYQDADAAEAFASDGGHKNSSNEALVRLMLGDGSARDEASAREKLSTMSAAEIAAYLRHRPVKKLLTAYDRDEDESLIAVPNVFGDGVVLPAEPSLSLLARGDGYHPVPVMLGTNRDENKTFLLFQRKHVKRFTPAYVRLRDPDRYYALADGMSRAWKVAGADSIAAAIGQSGGTAYVYRFDWDEQPTILGAELSKFVGAGHGVEIPFVFGIFDLGGTANWIFNKDNAPGRYALSESMMGYWTHFARNGAPGRGSDPQQAEWRPFKHAGGEPWFMVFDTVADGGVRMEQGELTFDQVIDGIERDRRLPDSRQRCAVLRETIRFVSLIPTERYVTLDQGRCKDYPLDQDPWTEGTR